MYVTNHQHSQVVSQAVAQGSGGQLVPPVRLLDGPACVYGILRGCDKIIRQCQWVGRTWYHVDHGYFRRGHYGGYYRITRNGFQWDGTGDYPADRWEALGIPVKPWRKSGRHIVLCPMSSYIANFHGINSTEWLEVVMAELARFTDRTIVIKPKDDVSPLAASLLDAWALVAHNSNAAIEAAAAGVPVFVLGASAAYPVSSGHLSNIESPRYPPREPWLHGLAYQQWTLDEIRRGECWEREA